MDSRPQDDATFAELAAWLIGASTHTELKLLFHMTLQVYMARVELGVPPFTPTVEALRSGRLQPELLSLVRDTDAEAELVEALRRAAA